MSLAGTVTVKSLVHYLIQPVVQWLVADYSGRTGLGWSLVGLGWPVGAGLAGQWLGQFAVRWAAENIQLFFWFEFMKRFMVRCSSGTCIMWYCCCCCCGCRNWSWSKRICCPLLFCCGNRIVWGYYKCISYISHFLSFVRSKKRFIPTRGPYRPTEMDWFFPSDLMIVILYHLYFYLLSKSSPSRCIWNKTKFHCLFWSQNDLISWTSFIWTLK